MSGRDPIPIDGPRRAGRRVRGRRGTIAAVAGLAVLVLGAGTTAAWPSVASAKSHTTATSARSPSATHWLVEAIGHEARIGSVRIDGKVTQGKSTIYLDLLVNGDGEGGGTFIQDGYDIEIERVGPVLYFNAPKPFWEKSASKAQADEYGGRWLEIPALDSRFISFDQFLSADDLVSATFEGHKVPLTVGKPTTYQGHKVVIVKEKEKADGKTATGSMYIAATGPQVVYRIDDDSPGEVSTVVFTHYGRAVALTVPPNAIDLS
jgi:hypothetical protein